MRDYKTYFGNKNKLLVDSLSQFSKGFTIYSKSITEDEQKESGFNYLLYTNGDVSTSEEDTTNYTVLQNVEVMYVSVDQENLDADIFELIQLLNQSGLIFNGAVREVLRIENQDLYADVITFSCQRLIKLGCCNGR